MFLTFVLCPSHSSTNVVSSRFASLYPLLYFLDHVVPPYSSLPYRHFLPCSSIHHGWQYLSSHVLRVISSFPFSHVLRGFNSNPALNGALLVFSEDPSIIFATVTCTASGCVINFVFPSHASPIYSGFGTTTFTSIHILLLVSRYKFPRIKPISPTCALPVCITLSMYEYASHE